MFFEETVTNLTIQLTLSVTFATDRLSQVGRRLSCITFARTDNLLV